MYSTSSGPAVRLVIAIVVTAGLVACQSPGDRLGAPTIEDRDIRTREFEDVSESLVFGSCLSSLQDLGFQIDEADKEFGVIVGSKRRDAHHWQDIAANSVILMGLIVLSVATQTDLTAIGGVPVDDEQLIRVSLIAWPRSNRDDSTWQVRATFQRTIIDTQGQATRLETIEDPELYQHLFEHLAHSLYLEKEVMQ